MDCSPPGSSVCGILQARILEWVAISFSKGSSRPRDQTRVSRIAGRCFTIWATRGVPSVSQDAHLRWGEIQLHLPESLGNAGAEESGACTGGVPFRWGLVRHWCPLIGLHPSLSQCLEPCKLSWDLRKQQCQSFCEVRGVHAATGQAVGRGGPGHSGRASCPSGAGRLTLLLVSVCVLIHSQKNCSDFWKPRWQYWSRTPPANAGDLRYVGSIPGSGRSSGEGNGSPLQCS